MRKSAQMWELEAARGKPIRELILDSLRTQGSLRRAAKELGLQPSTLSKWCRLLDIKLERYTEIRLAESDVA